MRNCGVERIQDDSQQKFKELLQDIYVIGQETKAFVRVNSSVR